MGFQVVPVLDILRGAAVHAIAGRRSHYQPVRSILHEGSDPVALARAYRDQLGLRSVYLADLDAILGKDPDIALYRELSALDLSLWIDAGLRHAEDADRIGDLARTSLVAGLETVLGPAAVQGLLARLGPERLIFSMDLNGGMPLTAPHSGWTDKEPLAIAHSLIELGVRRFILLDLARVGTGHGTGTDAMLREFAALGQSLGTLELTVGGGIAGIEGVLAARQAGASSVLLGSTLHDGRITRAMLEGLTFATRTVSN